jgi:pimeloyl-ACP methyl ester carboxylesterase
MPYATNEGVRIHYEVEGSGEPLVLQHGFSNNLELWRLCGYVEALKSDFRCILIDLRGHGLSDKPRDAAEYGVLKSAGDVVAVLDDAGLDTAQYWGYSMGGSIGLALMSRYPERFRSFVIGGNAPGPRREGSVAGLRSMQATLREGKDAHIANLPARWAPLHADIDPAALISTIDALIDRPNTEPFAPRVPCLIYNGSADGPAMTARQLKETAPANLRIEEIPGLNHLEGIDRGDLVLPVVLPFLAEVSERTAAS